MSRKTELAADQKRIGYQLSGAHLTRQARDATFSTFAKVMREQGYGIHNAAQIGGKHLQAFAAHRAQQGIGARARANELSHLRSVLVRIGKQGLARNRAYSNHALGIERGSRIGTKRPLSDDAIRAFQQRMGHLGRPAIGAILELQRALGLREAEAIRAGQTETLSRWERELRNHGSVRVVEGTKGGRPRAVHPANVERAIVAIRQALSVLSVTQQRYLVTRADGASTNLKEALGVYRNLCHRAQLQRHAARYAFAQERVEAYRAQGYKRAGSASSDLPGFRPR